MSQQLNQETSSLLQSSQILSPNQFNFYTMEQQLSDYFSQTTTRDSVNSQRQQGAFFYQHFQAGQCFQQSQPQYFKQIVEILEKGDFSTLSAYWNENFIKKLNFIIDNWQQMSIVYSGYFFNLLKVFIESINIFTYKGNQRQEIKTFYDNFYPSIIKTLEKIYRKTETRKDLYRAGGLPEEQKPNRINNNMMKLYVREQQMKANKRGMCYIDLRIKPREQNVVDSQPIQAEVMHPQPPKKIAGVPLGASEGRQIGKYIVENKLFANNPEVWKNFLFKATATCRYNKIVTPHPDIHKQIDKVYEFSDLTLKNNELTQPVDRLCCAKFFYFGVDLAPVNRQNLLTRQKLFEVAEKKHDSKKKKQEKQYNVDRSEMEDVMLDLCALLNSGGGVLLFNCEKQYLETRVLGEFLLQSQKKNYTEVINQEIRRILPQVEMDKQIEVTFVPMVKNPYEIGYNKEVFLPEQKQLNRQYIKGQYTMRIVATPSISDRVYCYQIDKKQSKSAIFQNYSKRVLRGAEISEYMRQKYDFFGVSQQDEQDSELLSKDFTLSIPHKCVQPYRGEKLEYKQELREDYAEASKYQNVCLLVGNKKNFEQIGKKFKKMGVQCWIYTKFQKYDFKASVNSAPLLHNQRFDQLLGKIAYNPDFTFDKRPIILINGTRCLRLKNRIGNDQLLPLQSFKLIQKWLHKQFQREQLEYWRIENDDGEIQHFLRTQKSDNNLAVMFLYYVLHHFDEKTVFKNPGAQGQDSSKEYKKIINKRAVRVYSDSKRPFFDDI